MVTRCLVALLMLWITTGLQAGGPPPMYVVVKKVVFTPTSGTPESIQIWGYFTRMEVRSEKFTKPTYGYIHLRLPSQQDDKLKAELADWKNAVGSSKPVTVGICDHGGTFLTCKIYQPHDTTGQTPDATYDTGHLRTYGDLFANEQLLKMAFVKDLLEVASQKK